jgi:hypothetical protein
MCTQIADGLTSMCYIAGLHRGKDHAKEGVSFSPNGWRMGREAQRADDLKPSDAEGE